MLIAFAFVVAWLSLFLPHKLLVSNGSHSSKCMHTLYVPNIGHTGDMAVGNTIIATTIDWPAVIPGRK